MINNQQSLEKFFCESRDISGLKLSMRNFSGLRLSGNANCAEFTGCNMRGADLSGATAENTNFVCADLTGVNLSGASAKGANFRGANLSGANVTGTNLKGANMQGADLTGVKLPDYIKPEQIIGAYSRLNCRTR